MAFYSLLLLTFFHFKNIYIFHVSHESPEGLKLHGPPGIKCSLNATHLHTTRF